MECWGRVCFSVMIFVVMICGNENLWSVIIQ